MGHSQRYCSRSSGSEYREQVVGCEGACDEHTGDIVRVHVWRDEHMKDWGEFNYCEEAIREDRSRGLRVEIVTPNKAISKQEH